jgi:hypothetical protein
MFIKLALFYKSLFSKSSGTVPPSLWVGFPIHNDSLGFGDSSMVAGGHLSSRHFSNSHGDSLSLGGHDDDFFAYLDAVIVSEDSGEHEFGSVANSIN